MRRAGNTARRALIILCAFSLPVACGVTRAQDVSPSDTILSPSTTEIPSAIIPDAQGADPAEGVAPADSGNSGPDASSEREQEPAAELRQQNQDLHDFMEEEEATSSLGMVLQEAHRGVDGDGEVEGLLVVDVLPGTPAAQAGLRGLHTGVNTALSGVAIAAAFIFPPAILAAAVINGTQVGESYDLIIGVDSERVTNFLEFSDLISRASPGELVYLNISRNGKRMLQVVSIPATSASGAP